MTTPPDGTVITPMDLRAHAGEFLDRVRLQHDTFIIERRGTPMAALVPIEGSGRCARRRRRTSG